MARAVFQATIINPVTLAPVPNASVAVYDMNDGGAFADLTKDRAGLIPISPNPTTADENGFIQFYVEPTRLDVVAADGNGGTQTFSDVLAGIPESVPAAAIPVGSVPTDRLAEASKIASSIYGTVTGADAYTFTSANPDLAAQVLEDGDQFRAVFPNTNTIAGATINIDGLGVKTLLNESGAALAIGYIGTTKYLSITYDEVNDAFRLQKEIVDVPVATETSIGGLEIATLSETLDGTASGGAGPLALKPNHHKSFHDYGTQTVSAGTAVAITDLRATSLYQVVISQIELTSDTSIVIEFSNLNGAAWLTSNYTYRTWDDAGSTGLGSTGSYVDTFRGTWDTFTSGERQFVSFVLAIDSSGRAMVEGQAFGDNNSAAVRVASFMGSHQNATINAIRVRPLAGTITARAMVRRIG